MMSIYGDKMWVCPHCGSSDTYHPRELTSVVYEDANTVCRGVVCNICKAIWKECLQVTGNMYIRRPDETELRAAAEAMVKYSAVDGDSYDSLRVRLRKAVEAVKEGDA